MNEDTTLLACFEKLSMTKMRDRYPCVFTKPKWQMGLVNLNFADVSDFDELVNNSFQVKLFLSIK